MASELAIPYVHLGVFVNNPSEKDLYSSYDLSHSTLLPFYQSGKRIAITYTPYQYNTQKYWMVFADLSSIVPLA